MLRVKLLILEAKHTIEGLFVMRDARLVIAVIDSFLSVA
jgi:hypothetical protein